MPACAARCRCSTSAPWTAASISSKQIAHPPRPGDRLRLYIFAKAPESFRMQGKGFGRENGCVLYVQDVFKP